MILARVKEKQMKQIRLTLIFTIGVLCFSTFVVTGCNTEKKKDAENFKSMEQIHTEEGVPVRVREIKYEPFATYLKYPAELRARLESTAFASLSDVVRELFVSIGDSVAKDQVVLTFSETNPVYQQAKVSLENAEANFKRSKDLFENNGISQQAYDNAKTAYELAQSAFKSADDMVNVKAPISGIITSLKVQVSSNVKPGDELFTVSNLNEMEAEMWVSPEEIKKVHLGQPARLKWFDRIFQGHVSRVNLIMDSKRKAFQVLVQFSNPQKLLTSGLTVDVEIETYRNPQAIVVKRTELLRENSHYSVYVANNGFAAQRKVEIGEIEGFNQEILSGLEPGDQLIIESLHLLADGAKIKIIP